VRLLFLQAPVYKSHCSRSLQYLNETGQKTGEICGKTNSRSGFHDRPGDSPGHPPKCD
jgi:hypothetical protein